MQATIARFCVNAASSRVVRCMASRSKSKTFTHRRDGTHDIDIVPKTKNQQVALDMLRNKDRSIVLFTGPAGTGKTYMACRFAMEALSNQDIEKVVITRPTIGVGEELGYLPGSLEDKMHPWVIPIVDTFNESIGKKATKELQYLGLLEISPLAYMRGRTFKRSIVILDEAQNTTASQMKMVLSRIGEESRIIVCGDEDQSDLVEDINGLTDVLQRASHCQDLKYLSMVRLDQGDIQRHEAVQELIDKVYADRGS